MRKTLAIILAGAMALSMTACSGKGTEDLAASGEVTSTLETTAAEALSSTEDGGTKAAPADGTVYNIGVLQLVQHTALDAAREGFTAALDDAGLQYKLDVQNASGDQSNCQIMAEKLVNDKEDLILAIATPAAQAVAGMTSDIPILVTAVTDPSESGLTASNDMPGGNVSGTSDLTPVKEQIDLMKQLIPDVKKVGILYSSSESNSVLQAEMAKTACEAAGLESKAYTVSSSNEIQTVVESMIGKVDAIYAPTDNTIAAGMATVAMVATDNHIPVICGESGMVKAGGLATYGIDYHQLGYLTGQQAVEILTKSADISKMPIGYLPADKCELTVNKTTADALSVDISGLKGAVIVE